MKFFTLSMLALFALGTTTASAQKMLPAHQTLYMYDDSASTWIQTGNYHFTYDKDGNITQQDNGRGLQIDRTLNEWENGMNTVQIIQGSTDGGKTFTNSTKRVQTYDSIYPHLITLSKDKYQWENGAWQETTDAFRRSLTRDAYNNVTSLTVSVPWQGGWDPTQRYTCTVDPETRQIKTFLFEELGVDNTGANFIWKPSQYLRNLKWKETNGQLVSSFDEWMNSGNKLESGNIAVIENGDTTDIATITITYDDKGGYTETIVYSDEPQQIVTTHTITDNNGSYRQDYVEYYDTDGDGRFLPKDVRYQTREIVRYDAKGNVIEESSMGLNERGRMELQGGAKYDITYSTEFPDAEAEVVMSNYDYESRTYIPYMRVVTDEYTDMDTAISSIKAGTVAAPDGVYNLQGMPVNNYEHAPRGLYIVRKNGKAVKVMK